MGSASGCSCGIGVPSTDYPPPAYYYMTDVSYFGSTLLVDGPTAIYYIRTMSKPCKCSSVLTLELPASPKPDDIFKYLEQLLGHGSLLLRASEYREFKLGEQKSLELELNRFRADILKRYELLLQICMNADLLAVEEKASLPPLKINMQVKYPPQ
jgi:hypothetical protein